MELTNEQKALLEKTLLHLHSFTLSIAKEFSEDKHIAIATMLAHNMELCDDLEPLIKPYMSEQALAILAQAKLCVTLSLISIEEDLTKLLGEKDEEI